MENWYVIQVRSGQEERILRKCRLLIDHAVLHDCFLPKCERMKKMRGHWEKVEELLFRGYVFLISDDVQALYHELYKIDDLTKLLGKHGEDIYPLYEKEVALLKSFGRMEHLVEMSVGYMEGERIVVMEGPLMGKEGMICKVDRHKRIAVIEVEMFGKTTTAKVGLEIVAKRT